MTHFNSVQTERLAIVGSVSLSALKWGTKAPGVQLFEANSSAKYLGTAAAAALGSTGFLIGTATATWEIRANLAATLLIGIAAAIRDLTSASPGADVLFHEIAASEGDIVRIDLGTANLTATTPGVVRNLSLTPYIGLTMRPWICGGAGSYAASIITTSGAAFSTNSAGELEIKSIAPVRIATGGGGLFVDGKASAAAADSLATAGGTMTGNIAMTGGATITGLAALNSGQFGLTTAPRRIDFSGGTGTIRADTNLPNALTIQSTTGSFMRFDSTTGAHVVNSLAPLSLSGFSLSSVGAGVGSFYETTTAVPTLTGSIIPGGPAITIPIFTTRIANIVTMCWNNSGTFSGTGVASSLLVSAYTLPISMRPGVDKYGSSLVANLGVEARGNVRVQPSGSIEFLGPVNSQFTGALAINIVAGSMSWNV